MVPIAWAKKRAEGMSEFKSTCFPLELSHGKVFLGSLFRRTCKPVLRTCSDKTSGHETQSCCQLTP